MKSFLSLALFVIIFSSNTVSAKNQFKFQYIRGRDANLVLLHSDQYEVPRVIFSRPHGLMSNAYHEYSRTLTNTELDRDMAQGLVWAYQDYSYSIRNFYKGIDQYLIRLVSFNESLKKFAHIIQKSPGQRKSAISLFEKEIDLKYPPELKTTIWEKVSNLTNGIIQKITPNSHEYQGEREFFLATIKRVQKYSLKESDVSKLNDMSQKLGNRLAHIKIEKGQLNQLLSSDQQTCIDISWKNQVEIFNEILFGKSKSPWKYFRRFMDKEEKVFDKLYLQVLNQILTDDSIELTSNERNKCQYLLGLAYGVKKDFPFLNHQISAFVPFMNKKSRRGFEGLYDLLFYQLFKDNEHKPIKQIKADLNIHDVSKGDLLQLESAVQLSNICQEKNDYLYKIWKDQESTYSTRKQYLEKNRLILRNKVRREVMLSSLQLTQEMLPIISSNKDLPAFPSSCPKLENSNGDLEFLQKKMAENRKWIKNYSIVAKDKEIKKRYLYLSIEASLINTLMESYAWKDHLWPVDDVTIPEGNFTPWYPVDTFPPKPGHMQHRLNRIFIDFPLLKWRIRYDLNKPLSWSGFSSSRLIDKLDPLLTKATQEILQKAPALIKQNFLELVAKKSEHNDLDEDMTKWFESTPKQKVLVNRDQQRVLRSIFHFLSFQLPILIHEIVDKESITWKQLEPTINSYYTNWKKHIENMNIKACTTDNKSLYESLPSLVLTHLSRKQTQNTEIELAGQLDSYCNGSFGNTWRNVFEQYGPSLGTGLFILGVSMPVVDPVYSPTVKSATYTTGIAIAAISSAMRAHKGVDEITTETALFKLSEKAEHEKDFGIVADVAKTAMAAIFGRSLGNWISQTRGWRFFVPYKVNWTSAQYAILFSNFGISTAFDLWAHIDKNINPFTSKWFWMSRSASFLSALLFAHAGDPGTLLRIPLMSAYNSMGQIYLYSEVEIAFRNLQLIEHPSLSFVEFEAVWQLGPNFFTSSGVYGANLVFERIVPAKYVGIAQFAISELEAFLSLGYYGKGKMNYLEDGLGFFDSVFNVDFKEDLMRIRKEASLYKTDLSKERIQASKEIFDSLPEENRRQLKAIFCINYGFQKLKQKMNPIKLNEKPDSDVLALAFTKAEDDPIIKVCELDNLGGVKE